MSYFMAFLVGGSICALGQTVFDRTKLTMAHVIVIFMAVSSLLTSLGLYQALIRLGGAGATIPVTNFGFVLTQGAILQMERQGFFGLLNGVFHFAGGALTATVVIAVSMALIFRPKG